MDSVTPATGHYVAPTGPPWTLFGVGLERALVPADVRHPSLTAEAAQARG